eukprot:SM003613S13828  [mRNA]  locus=s3613:364:725:- [translate_table: standard]
MGAVAWPTLGDAKQKAAAPSMRSSDDTAKTAPSDGPSGLQRPAGAGGSSCQPKRAWQQGAACRRHRMGT